MNDTATMETNHEIEFGLQEQYEFERAREAYIHKLASMLKRKGVAFDLNDTDRIMSLGEEIALEGKIYS